MKTQWMICLLCAACGGTADENTTEEDNRAAALEELLACDSEQFDVARPMAGPGIDPDTGELIGEPLESYLVHSTHIVIRPEQEDAFLEQSFAVLGELGQSEGIIGYSLARDEGCDSARTLGIWESEEAIYRFVASDVHEEAMRRTAELSLAARATNWRASAAELEALDWDVAKERMSEVPLSPYSER